MEELGNLTKQTVDDSVRRGFSDEQYNLILSNRDKYLNDYKEKVKLHNNKQKQLDDKYIELLSHEIALIMNKFVLNATAKYAEKRNKSKL